MKLLALAALLLLSGCATVMTRCISLEYGTPLYPATRLDLTGLAYFTDPAYNGGEERHWLAAAPVLDLVPSLLTDTILLPVDLVFMAAEKGEQE